MCAVISTGLASGLTPFRPEWVVLLQPAGSRSPLFFFPSSHSDPAMASDGEIARLIAADRPVWGLAHTDLHRSLVRDAGVAALAAEYVIQIQTLQPAGPYHLFGTCMGGHLAWETASQLLAQDAEVAELCFFEAPLRARFAEVRSGPIPVESPNVWRLGHYYAPSPLPVRLRHLMTPEWHDARWWRPWDRVAQGGTEVVVLPDDGSPSRAERLAAAIRAWCMSDGP